ncbi:hypothetical protein RJ639_039274 [Escallonia herrerae]|uniref:Uncharacterized protein n=1 Tax=Escallonia herrerae TaxID=1293975 RepID=A0AA88WP87_9ASTE|nr:hypothetical protein RJ639_039274 [Escallonia herrerae]
MAFWEIGLRRANYNEGTTEPASEHVRTGENCSFFTCFLAFRTDSNEQQWEKEKAKLAGVRCTVKPFVNGGASGMLATCVIQPIDMIKLRIQLGQGSARQVMRTMLKNEGIGAFYKSSHFGVALGTRLSALRNFFGTTFKPEIL